ncbi:peptide deformylase [Methylocucumis oryzae]|uniref:Peptide deformylase n=1 Tax=Methylocucumis oryzae TaxID=1632867 RepID=A0A0F3ILS5_9GAMM|nr:peptide deformylase [Methylocucumis oryzae]KJV07483.1 peptide deformylase [Methylocucumis oryzae]
MTSSNPLEIAQLGAEVLRLTAMPVENISAPETQQIITLMLETLSQSEGVGIAAPQLHVNQRIIVIASRPTKRYPYAPSMPATVMINPCITAHSEQQEKDWEGCLSIPGIRALVPRYIDIEATYIDLKGEPQSTRLTGFPARVFQHEYDHLDGLVYLDRVTDSRDIISETEFFKRLA